MALTKISTDGVKDDAVDQQKIADECILNSNINTSAAIQGSKLADNSISLAKLQHGDSNNNGKFLRANNGADPSFETVSIPAGTTINNNADNRVITGSGTANTLEGESTLTYANPNLEINTDTSAYASVILNGNDGGLIQFEDNEVSKWQIFGDSAFNIYDDVNNASRLYIDSSGRVHIGNSGLSATSNSDDLTVGNLSGDHGITIHSATDSAGFICFGDTDTTGVGSRDGVIRYQQSDSSMRFATNGNNERMRIDSSGNVGIGTTNPNGESINGAQNLVIMDTTSDGGMNIKTGTSGNAQIHFSDTSANGQGRLIYAHANDSMQIYTAGSKRMEINSSGNVGINSDGSGPDKLLHVSDSNAGGAVIPFRLTNVAGSSGTEVRMEFECGVDEVAYISAKNEGSDTGPLIFATASSQAAYPTEKMQLNKQGDLQIGQSANDCRLGIKQRSSNVHFIDCRNTSGTYKMYVHDSGNIYNTNGSYSQISDQSLKENIVDAKSQWNDIKNIKIRNFNFTEASGLDTHTQIGCVAQEVELVSPKLVTSPRDDGIKTVSNSVLYMKAVKALQEAMAKIETLETKVAALEAA